MDPKTGIYLNNAGTSWPKPPCVVEAIAQTHGAHPDTWPGILARAHAEVTAFFGIAEPSRFLFTNGCTSALAVALADLPWYPGDRIIISGLEHHALARPVVKLARERGVEYSIAPYASGAPVDLEFVRAELARGRVKLIACTTASNVTGELLPVSELIDLAHAHEALCLVDGAQTAGIFPIDLAALEADLFAFAGHKGPLGPQGVGGLYIAPHVVTESPAASCELRIGSAASADPADPAGPWPCSSFPTYCDVGSVNLAAVAGLAAGLGWLRERGQTAVRSHTRALATRLCDGLAEISEVTVHGSRDSDRRTSAISISLDDRAPDEIAVRLRQERGVIVSAGHQCAPMAHETLGTSAHGTLRLSPGPFNTLEQMDDTLDHLRAVL
ncbi:MAG: aminotransferase class V-fold PLP-dependent enzyme [Proteobacteria bacterium]|nr:aminotransferase class V-fold PLP-dependent enzyme [Pseudomonadota bacterium]